MYSYNKTDEKH